MEESEAWNDVLISHKKKPWGEKNMLASGLDI